MIEFTTLSWRRAILKHLIISNYCISYRNHPVSRRNVRTYSGTKRGYFWSPGQRCWINCRPELRFGRAKAYWLYRHHYRQAPVHNPIIFKLYNLVLLFTYAFKLLELSENLRCIILGTYWLNTRTESEIAAMLIGPVKACHSRDL